MKGLEICKSYYETYGLPMLQRDFPHLMDKLAMGLVGPGSECFGFDDEISLDHDFEPGFCIFLPSENEISRQEAFQLERAYAKLPQEFMGLKRQKINPAGGNRHGVIRIQDFYSNYISSFETTALITTPDSVLAEVTNGEVFYDAYGKFTTFRNIIKDSDANVIMKKMCAAIMMMDQTGMYNYQRCMEHHQPLAAALALNDFCIQAVRTIYLLNNQYCPYFKWMFKGAETLPLYVKLKPAFEDLLIHKKQVLASIQAIVKGISEETCIKYDLQQKESQDLQSIAFELNNCIDNPEIRNLDIYFGL